MRARVGRNSSTFLGKTSPCSFMIKMEYFSLEAWLSFSSLPHIWRFKLKLMKKSLSTKYAWHNCVLDMKKNVHWKNTKLVQI